MQAGASVCGVSACLICSQMFRRNLLIGHVAGAGASVFCVRLFSRVLEFWCFYMLVVFAIFVVATFAWDRFVCRLVLAFVVPLHVRFVRSCFDAIFSLGMLLVLVLRSFAFVHFQIG